MQATLWEKSEVGRPAPTPTPPRVMYQLNVMLLWTRIAEREAKRKRREEPFTGCGWADQGRGEKDSVEALHPADWESINPVNRSTEDKKEEVHFECARGIFGVSQTSGHRQLTVTDAQQAFGNTGLLLGKKAC